MLLLLSLVAGGHFARLGTPTSRMVSGLGVLAVLLGWIARALWTWRSDHRGRSAVHAVVKRIDRELADRTSRAMRLAEGRHDDAVTRALAQLHLDSVLSRIGHERLLEAARATARRWAVAAGVLLLGWVAGIVLGPLRLVEGLDVLISRSGKAPVSIEWLDEVSGEVVPPRYLRQESGAFAGFGRTRQSRGSIVSIHGLPLHPDRKLVLTDGKTEAPFLDDGHGGVVARWTLGDTADLQIAARFGDVLIVQGDGIELVSIPDQAPQVQVEGAPRTVRLLDESEIEVRYEVVDDHGLTQIDLVLRAGQREERRSLARFDGQETLQRGSAVVRPNDKFMKQAFVPVQITVEARDNDPITGPKWGRSMPITVIPPSVGEAEARRFERFKTLLDKVVDLTASRIEWVVPDDVKARAEHAGEEASQHKSLQAEVNAAVAEVFGGLKVPRSLGALINARLDRIAAAIEAERSAPGAQQARAAHEKTRAATEDAALAMDIGLRMLASTDATIVARRLADAADDAASGAKEARSADRERGLARLDAAVKVLQSGSEWVLKLDRLGKDLGEVIGIGVRRIQRSQQAQELEHAELAARDLALRLRRPLPSFTGGGGRRSTEAGGMPQAGDSGDSEGEVAKADQQRNEIDSLAKEHGDEMRQLEEELAKAMREAGMGELRDQGREHARAVRESVRKLPSSAADSSSPEGAAAMARESAQAMADALEHGNLPEAVARGRNALRAMEHAKRLSGQQRDFFGDPLDLATELDAAHGKLDREQKWAEQQLDKLRKSVTDKTRGRLDGSATAEDRFAERTGEAGRKGRSSETPLPKSMLDLLDGAEKSMRQSSKALKSGDVDKGMEQQREAQRQLEMAREVQGKNNGDDDSDQGDIGGPVDIPKAKDFQGPEAFRKRVLQGLGGSRDPKLREAVRRYAEGLLR